MTVDGLVTSALRYASEACSGTFRPDSKRTPFVTHLSETAELVAKGGGTPQEVAAAWLHDLVEDGHTTVETITERFGPEVAALVEAVTDPEDTLGESILVRKERQAERLARAPRGAKLIKLAEQISILRALTDERPLSWTIERSIAYVEGTQRVADICRGASPALDALFVEAHAAAAKTVG